jgi:hypothetical protein
MLQMSGQPQQQQYLDPEAARLIVAQFYNLHGRTQPSKRGDVDELFQLADVTLCFDAKQTVHVLSDVDFSCQNRQVLLHSIACVSLKSGGFNGMTLNAGTHYVPHISRTYCHRQIMQQDRIVPSVTLFTDTYPDGMIEASASRFYLHHVGARENPLQRQFPSMTEESIRNSPLKQTYDIEGVPHMCVPVDSDLGVIIHRLKHECDVYPVFKSQCYVLPQDDGATILTTALSIIRKPLRPVAPTEIKFTATNLDGAPGWWLWLKMAIVYSLPRD